MPYYKEFIPAALIERDCIAHYPAPNMTGTIDPLTKQMVIICAICKRNVAREVGY